MRDQEISADGFGVGDLNYLSSPRIRIFVNLVRVVVLAETFPSRRARPCFEKVPAFQPRSVEF